MILNKLEIEQLEQRYRANLINSLHGFKCLSLIATKSPQGNDNLAVFNSLFHIGANPALCGFVLRPNEIKQNTLGNIINTHYYTFNHVLPNMVDAAHQTSAKYPEGISEFEQVGLTTEFIDGIYAPFVKESCVKFACKFVEKIDIKLNGTSIIIGEIIKIILPDNIVLDDGFLDLELADIVTVSGLDSYHKTQKIKRLPYAKYHDKK